MSTKYKGLINLDICGKFLYKYCISFFGDIFLKFVCVAVKI